MTGALAARRPDADTRASTIEERITALSRRCAYLYGAPWRNSKDLKGAESRQAEVIQKGADACREMIAFGEARNLVVDASDMLDVIEGTHCSGYDLHLLLHEETADWSRYNGLAPGKVPPLSPEIVYRMLAKASGIPVAGDADPKSTPTAQGPIFFPYIETPVTLESSLRKEPIQVPDLDTELRKHPASSERGGDEKD